MNAVASLGATSWAPGGAARFTTAYAGGPAVRIASWALEYMWPLDAWLDGLVGDPGEVEALAARWNAAGRELVFTVATCDAALEDIVDMQGKSVRALRRVTGDLAEVAQHVSQWTEAVAASLSLASQIVTALHSSVAGALSELAKIVVALFDVAEAFTDPLEYWDRVARLTEHVDAFVAEIEQLIYAMFDTLGELDRLLKALVPLIGEAATALRELMSQFADTSGRINLTIGGMVFGSSYGLLGLAAGAVLGNTAAGIASDLLASDPTVTELDRDDLTAQQAEAWDEALACERLDTLTDFVRENGNTDSMGKRDRSVVDIKLVEDPDGSQHYVVSLPSTQDWNLIQGALADYPATNDLDTNVALMLSDHPEFATQYQRGVYEAMRQAGVPEGAPVVYSGFSQGGIMAANLAADRNSPYDTVAILTTGAPVDGFDIPDSVEVVSFAQRGDPVPLIDEMMDPLGPSFQKWTIPLENATDAEGRPGSLMDIHSSTGYAQAVAAWEAANPAEAQRVASMVGGTVVDHQIYTFEE